MEIESKIQFENNTLRIWNLYAPKHRAHDDAKPIAVIIWGPYQKNAPVLTFTYTVQYNLTCEEMMDVISFTQENCRPPGIMRKLSGKFEKCP